MARRDALALHRSKFEVTPILVGDKLVMCTPFNEVIALDPGSGKEIWRFDPKIRTDYHPANLFNCRGVAFWRDSASAPGPCATRIFTVTNDARLIALDLASGARCRDFGTDGEFRIEPGKKLLWPGEWQMTSAPTVFADLIIVGSAIGDNARVDAPRGTVRAFDARSGVLRWQWDPIPSSANDPAAASWGAGWEHVGAANVWAPMSVDEKRHLVFLPTTSPSPDFYGGLRPGNNLYADSVVALDANTGQRVWSFQTVHHDVWDYDIASQPSLATITIDGHERDVVVQGTKQGLIFVLDRDTGLPVLPVEERPVPQSGVAGESLSPTQPFPVDLPPLVPDHLKPEDAWGVTPWDREACKKLIGAARAEGLYTPPSLQGTLLFPFTGGGVNWGGVAVDAAKGIVFANTSRLAHVVTLFPADQFDAMDERYPDKEVSKQEGAPFGMKREVVLSPLKLPCNPPPWGTLAAVDLNARKILWQVPIGTTEALDPIGLARKLGTPTFGGPLATAGGLVFIGATLDNYLRAIDAKSGAELWLGHLPAAGIATPTSYEWHGRQYVVIAAGGHGDAGAPTNDALVAFALPLPGEAGRSLWSRWINHPGRRLETHLVALLIVVVALLLAYRLWRARRRARLN
jgi:quinoprotein glucose dehydrogenase